MVAALCTARHYGASTGQNFGDNRYSEKLLNLLQLLRFHKRSEVFSLQLHSAMRIGVTENAKYCVCAQRAFKTGECILECDFDGIEHGLISTIFAHQKVRLCLCCNVRAEIARVDNTSRLKIIACWDITEGEQLIFACSHSGQ